MYKHKHFISPRSAAGIKIPAVLVMSILFCAVLLMCASLAFAGSLRGIVVGKAGDPKRYVRVTLIGRETRTTFTNNRGIFVLQVQDGNYRIVVSEKGNRQAFEAQVPGNREFRVNW